MNIDLCLSNKVFRPCWSYDQQETRNKCVVGDNINNGEISIDYLLEIMAYTLVLFPYCGIRDNATFFYNFFLKIKSTKNQNV